MNVSLLGGWFPATLEVVAAAVLLLAVGWRTKQWRLRTVPLVVGGAVLGTLLMESSGARLIGLTDPLPFSVWFWFGTALGALIVLAAGWRTARWWRRGTALVAAALAALVCANGLNQFVGYYPTIDSAVNDWTNAPLPGQQSLSGLAHDAVDGKLPRAGSLVAVNIPATYSGFRHRQELVYLPPVWFRPGRHHPALPVVELIGGERGGPADWVRLGNAVQTSDAYAHLHHGFAPILVFTDPIAQFNNDTECVNGPRGNSADHLVKDIPAYIEKTFGASRNPEQWAVAGFSMGGTCSLDLVVEHPATFRHFIDISGDLAPNSGLPPQTLHDLYGGNVAAMKANEPLLVMKAHGRYRGVSGLFLTSTDEVRHQNEAEELSQAAAKVDIASRVEISPGSHVWQFAGPAFASAYPWLVNQLAAAPVNHETRLPKPA